MHSSSPRRATDTRTTPVADYKQNAKGSIPPSPMIKSAAFSIEVGSGRSVGTTLLTVAFVVVGRVAPT